MTDRFARRPADHQPRGRAPSQVSPAAAAILDHRPQATALRQLRRLAQDAPRAVLQRQAIEVFRKLPLTQSLNWQKPDVALMGIKDALRAKFPVVGAPLGADEGRGAEYLAALTRHSAEIDADKAGRAADADIPGVGHGRDKIAVFAPHVAGVATTPRTRANSSQADGMNKLEQQVGGDKNHWLGAHLVKREWGGEDNVWNVVAWSKATEDRWAAAVEDPLDRSFLLGEVEDAVFELSVTKEDEVWSAAAISDAVDTRLAGTPELSDVEGDGGKASRIRAHIAGQAEKARVEANAAVERVPTSVRAVCGPVPSVTFAMQKGDTEWPRAQMISFESIVSRVDANVATGVLTLAGDRKGYNANALAHSKDRDAIRSDAAKDRTRERETAHNVEKKNLGATTAVLDPDLRD